VKPEIRSAYVATNGFIWELQLDHEAGTATVLSIRKNDARPARIAVPPPTPRAADPGGGIVTKAKSWLRAEVSALVHGKVDDANFGARMAACRACNRLDPLPEPKVGYCTACGCGRGLRAELTVKGRLPEAKCPLKKWDS
jgi:hypothetical protein